jgi:hypothetical protein
MKKILMGFFLAAVLIIGGCSGLPYNPDPTVDKLTNISTIFFLQNNPKYKAPLVEGLEKVKVVLAKESVTYQDVIDSLNILIKQKTEYGFVFYILLEDIQTDTPIFQNPLSTEYRLSLIKRIDKLLFLINAYVR